MRPPGGLFIVLLSAAFAFLNGCQTTESGAPTVDSLSLRSRKIDLTTLEHGRSVFLRSCAECHQLQPIRKYSVSRWHEIVGIMAPRARLNSQDRAALEAYLVAARRSYPE
jgi:hypothetical protein